MRIRSFLTLTVLFVALLGAGACTGPALATVNEVTASNRYTANGSTTDFTYGFMIYTKNDIEVLVGSTVKTVDTDYTVSGLGSSGGGTVTFLVAPANASIVTLLRKQAASQLSTYVPNEAFPSTRVEKDFDKLVMEVQQLKEQISRALKFGKSSSLVDQSVDDPTTGSFARAKVGGGVDWATVTSAGTISIPVPVNQGGTGATTSTGTGSTVLSNTPTIASPTISSATLTSPTVSTGPLTVTSGQIAFPATQSASADANTLDDYEEGDWTPSVGGNATYTTRVGTYVKTGKVVFIHCSLLINVIGTGDTSTISGLPFTATSPGGMLTVGDFNSLATNVVWIAGKVITSSTSFTLRNLTAAGASTTSSALLGNGSLVILSGFYFTS